jgi:hypothetical protein
LFRSIASTVKGKLQVDSIAWPIKKISQVILAIAAFYYLRWSRRRISISIRAAVCDFRSQTNCTGAGRRRFNDWHLQTILLAERRRSDLGVLLIGEFGLTVLGDMLS